MVSNLAKVAIGVTGVASVGATAVYLSASKTEEKKPEKDTTKPISALLTENGKALLEDSDAEWKNKWTEFKKDHSKEKPRQEPWSLNDWKTEFDNAVAPNSFKAKCKSNIEKEIKNKQDNLYIEVVSFCAGDIKRSD